MLLHQSKKVKLEKKLSVIKNDVSNAPYRVFDHIQGARFSRKHKLTCGSIIICIGVVISDVGHGIAVLHYFVDMIMVVVNGAGAVPFFDAAAEHITQKFSEAHSLIQSGLNNVEEKFDAEKEKIENPS